MNNKKSDSFNDFDDDFEDKFILDKDSDYIDINEDENFYQNNDEFEESEVTTPMKKKSVWLKIAVPSCLVIIAAVIIGVIVFKNSKLPSAPSNPYDTASDSESISDTVSMIINSDYEIPTDTVTDLDLSDVDIKNVNLPFVKGIKLGGLDLSGMTYDDAYQYVESNKIKFVDKRKYEIICDGKTYEITEDDFTYETNAFDKLTEAYALSTKMHNEASSDSDSIDENLSTDIDFKVDYTLNMESVSSAVSNFAKKVNKPVVELQLKSFNPNAKKGSQFTFANGKPGKEVDKEAIIETISSYINQNRLTGSLTCETKPVNPILDAKEIQSKMTLLASYSTYSTNGYNGNHNMSISMAAVNGTLLFKGDVFSFNGCTGDSNLESNGYLPAGVIANGQLTTGVGGGICQSATTIYNAGVRAGLTIIERGPHLWASAYVPVGLDAVIDYGNLDLKMRNDQKTPIYFSCSMSGNKLTCKIYGVQPDWYDKITCKSWVTDINYGVGYSAAACRIYWKGNKQVKTEALKSSYYSLSQGYVRSNYDEYQEYLEELKKKEEEAKKNSDTDKPKPKPTDTDKPKPTDTDKPKPTDTDKPKPTDTDKPKPTDTDTSTPKPTDTDKPIDTNTDVSSTDSDIVSSDINSDSNSDITSDETSDITDTESFNNTDSGENN